MWINSIKKYFLEKKIKIKLNNSIFNIKMKSNKDS